MLLDTIQGFRKFKRDINAFVLSSNSSAAFKAEVAGNPEPYLEFLNGLRVQKSEETAKHYITKDHWLELLGCEIDLEKFASHLAITGDGDHVHFYCSPVSLVIEVDESWPGWVES